MEAPENGVYEWIFKGVMLRSGFMRNEYAHLAKQGDHEVQVRHIDVELQKWEVVSWRYELSFEDLFDKGVRAFNGTSFRPDERAEEYLRQYEAACIEDLKQLPQEEHEDYTAKFRGWVETLFDKHSRVMSTMITGPARFPTSRNEKACNSYDKAVNEFTEWRENYAKRVAKRIEAAKTPEQREAEEWERLKRNIEYCAEARLQIFHNEKPAAEVISRLKANGFKWSRFNGCWQRQLTDNAYYGVARVFFGNDVLSEERQQFINQLRAAR